MVIVQIEEVGIVEQRGRARIGDDTLTEEIAELVGEVATDDKIEIFAVETIGVAHQAAIVEVLVVEIGASRRSWLKTGESTTCARDVAAKKKSVTAKKTIDSLFVFKVIYFN